MPLRCWPALLFLVVVATAGRAGELAAPDVPRRLLGYPPVQSFTTRDGATINFRACGWTKDGLLVVAQDSNLLEFDGRDWRVIAKNGPKQIQSLLISKHDARIYVSGYEDIGYFEPDSTGTYKFTSIAQAVKSLAPFYLLRAQSGDTVYLTTTSNLLAYSPRGTRRWPTPGLCSGAWKIDERVFVADGTAGFLELAPEGFRPAPGGGERFTNATDPVAFGASMPDGSLVLATLKRLYRYDGREFTPISHPEFTGRPSALTVSEDGWIAVQQTSSIDLFDKSLVYRGTLREFDRLLRLSVRTLLPDAPEGLWIGSGSGLLRLELGNIASNYAEEVGLSLPINNVIVRGNRLVAVNSYDIGQAEMSDEGLVGRFKTLGKGLPYCARLLADQRLLVIAEQDKQRTLHIDDTEKIPVADSARLHHVNRRQADSLMFVVDGRGDTMTRLTREAGGWRAERDWLKVPAFVFSMEDDTEDNLWLGIGADRLARARPPYRSEDLEYFDQRHGLPQGWMGLLRLENKLLFETHHGVYEFDSATRRFRPSPINARLPSDLANSPATIRVADPRHLWISGANRSAIVALDAEANYVGHTVLSYRDTSVTFAARQQNGVVWLSTPSGLVRVDPRASVPPLRPFKTSIRQLNALGEHRERLYGGAGEPPAAVSLSGDRNSIEIRVAADCWDRPESTAFQHRLVGETGWSDWSESTLIVKPALSAGRHLLEIRSRDADGRLGASVELTLDVAPPWFRTWWAYTVFGFAAVAALGLSAWLASRYHRRRARQLEEAVETRTRVISEQATEILQQNTRLIETNQELETAIRQRQDAEHERELAHRQLMVASRQAGMAEIAASVLHNVGNALNSISTSAGQARESALRIDVARIHRIVDFIAHNPAQFSGEKTPMLRSYLEQLADAFGRERATLGQELARVREGIEHVEAIISAQQRFTGAPGLLEDVSVRELVHGTLQLCADSFQRHGVRLDTRFPDDLPALRTDKHKVLQILVNLLSNARQACLDGPKPAPRVLLSVALATPRELRFTVEDNGAGIAPEILPRLFQFGFTTRADGHGFGLHSSILAAKQLGGTLTAHSDGPGRGARFELTLPLAPPAP